MRNRAILALLGTAFACLAFGTAAAYLPFRPCQAHTPSPNQVREGGLCVPVAATSVAGPIAATSVAGSIAATSVAGSIAATSVAGSIAATSVAGPIAATSVAGSVAATSVARSDAQILRARDVYHKREEMIPMRDGVRLFTAIYTPKDASQPHPILMERTPYSAGPYGPDRFRGVLGPGPEYMREGYIIVVQDVRGRFMSEGLFEDMRPLLDPKVKARNPKATDESTDTWDTIEWLKTNVPNNNGRVGMWGISYPGFYAAAGMVQSHPALKAVSPQAPIADWFVGDDDHHNGALFLMDCFSFQTWFGPPRPKPTTEWPPDLDYGTNDGFKFYMNLGPLTNANKRYFHHRIKYWNDVMSHGAYDAFWQSHSLPPRIGGVKCAVLIVGGWFDAEDLYGPLKIFATLRQRQPSADSRLVMGPWTHGGWAGGLGEQLYDVPWGAPTAKSFREDIQLPFFNHYLKGSPMLDLPAARVFQTGANRWRSFYEWPPTGLAKRAFYLWPGRRVSTSPPMPRGGSDSYMSDPARPVPYTSEVDIRRNARYMIEDQRFTSGRSDVLVYRGPPQSEDLTLAGPLRAELWVSTSGTDADFIVKVMDEYPADDPNPKLAGYRMLVRAEIMRGKFRDSLTHPKPFLPGRPTPVRFDLRDICHTFRKGHRLDIQIQSTWFPLVDRNPQKFCDIYHARANDFRRATIRIFHDRQHPSRLVAGALPADASHRKE